MLCVTHTALGPGHAPHAAHRAHARAGMWGQASDSRAIYLTPMVTHDNVQHFLMGEEVKPTITGTEAHLLASFISRFYCSTSQQYIVTLLSVAHTY